MRFSLSVAYGVISSTVSGTRFRFLSMLSRRSHATGDGGARHRVVVVESAIAVPVGGAGSLDHHHGINRPDAAQQGVRTERLLNALGAEALSSSSR